MRQNQNTRKAHLPRPKGKLGPPGLFKYEFLRKSDPSNSSGNAKLLRNSRNMSPTFGSNGWAAKSTSFSLSFRSNSGGSPGSCTLTLWILFKTGFDISAMATVPFSKRSTFFTAPSFKYSRNREYDNLFEVASKGLSGSALAGRMVKTPDPRSPNPAVFRSFLLLSLASEEESLWTGASPLTEVLVWFSLQIS